MNLFKSFDRGLGKNMLMAARLLGGMDSSNPRRWKGERLHHHGDGVWEVVCAFCAVKSGHYHSSYVTKYWNITLMLM